MTTSSIDPRIEESWKRVLADEFKKSYLAELKQFLVREQSEGRRFHPSGNLIFNAFNLTPFDQVKVVIIGQDPYHGPGQAHGLSFSVPDGVAIPPSLKNIYREIELEIGTPAPHSGNLERWAKQGVLMLNATLTVESRKAGSHQGKGWETFTDAVVKALNDQRDGLVFMLWGRYAREKGKIIDRSRHHVLEAAHPSPFSASNGFFGCGHFAKANEILARQGEAPIDW